MFYLLQSDFTRKVTDVNSAGSYFPVALQIVFAVGLIAFLVVVTHLLGPKRKTSDKLQNFTSGIETHGDARQPMAIKYFLVAILFVLFDVEVIFFYPYAVNFKALGWSGFWAVLLFVAFFLCGFIYIIKKGALKWED
ncbi:MAG: NADH-quinone oxidoreductase subunit A [Flavisolibacter sp.]